MSWSTEQQDGIHFITGLAGNVKFQKITAHWLDTAVAPYKATGEEVRMFHSFMYKAGTSNGFYQKNHVVLGKYGPIGLLLRRHSVVAMNNAG